MKRLMLLMLLLSSLACGMQTQAGEFARPFYIGAQADAEMSIAVKMTVTAYQLNVRDDANGQIVEGFYLIQNDTVFVYDEITIGDINWCRITPVGNAPRWVACGWLRSNEK